MWLDRVLTCKGVWRARISFSNFTRQFDKRHRFDCYGYVGFSICLAQTQTQNLCFAFLFLSFFFLEKKKKEQKILNFEFCSFPLFLCFLLETTSFYIFETLESSNQPSQVSSNLLSYVVRSVIMGGFQMDCPNFISMHSNSFSQMEVFALETTAGEANGFFS